MLKLAVQLCDYLYTTDGILLANYGAETYNAEGKLESMNVERCVELYQQAYDRYMENHAA